MDKSNSKPQKNKLDSIQFFRFIAALMVVIYHASIYTSERLTPNFPRYEQGGIYSIILFFVISGFVMIMSTKSIVGETTGWKIFAVKRIIRIIPIYWMVNTFKVLALLSNTSLNSNSSMDFRFILKSYFFIPAINSNGFFFPFYNVGWTLNFEMFFYFLFTMALAIRINPIVFLAIILIPLTILSFYKNLHWPDVVFYFDPIVLNFLSGMIAAKLVLWKIKFPRNFALPVIVLCLLYLFLPKTGVIKRYFDNYTVILYISAFLIVYAGASIESNWRGKIANWLIFLGGTSYSLYLVHPLVAPSIPFVFRLMKLQWPWLSLVSGVVMSIAAGVVFYRFCEEPLTKFLSRFTLRRWFS